jgi:hypothetical protein
MTARSIRDQVAEMRPKRFTTADAAAAVEVSLSTIIRWRRTGGFVPSESMAFGDLTVHLYTPADIRELRKFAADQLPGRKPASRQPSAVAAKMNGSATQPSTRRTHAIKGGEAT